MTLAQFIKLNIRPISFVVFITCLGWMLGSGFTGFVLGLGIVAGVNWAAK